MTEVVVRPGEPDEYRIPFTHGWERRQIVGRMRRLKIRVPRSEARAANLNAKVDRIELPGIDTVRLTDVQTGGSTWTLVCYSAEWDANRAGFTPGGDVREGDDQTLISNLVGEVSTWSAGSIANLTGPLSFVFSHAHRHEALRRIETNVPGEIQFRDFGTVDYVDRLGSDRSGSVTLSPDAGTIEGGGIEITERGRELDGTHIRVLGAHEGEAQLFVNLVPEDDPATYENEVRYPTPRWTEAADTDWDRWSNNDITDQSTLETEAAALGEELAESLVKAETTVPTSVGLNVGDTVRVVKDDADLDRDMRVHRLTRKAGTFNDASDAAVVDRVHLSTRTTLQTDDDAELEEIRKFNTGFQGSSVVITPGPFGKAVDSGNPLEFKFRYPDIEFENDAELNITGLPYRIDSQGAASGGGAVVTSQAGGTNDDTTASGGGFTQSETSSNNSPHGRVASRDSGLVSLQDTGGNWFAVDTLSAPAEYEFATVNFIATSPDNVVEVRVSGATDEYPQSAGVGIWGTGTESGSGATSVFVPDDVGDLSAQYKSQSSAGNIQAVGMFVDTHTHTVTLSRPDHTHQFDWLHDHTVDVPSHTHEPQPGIYTTADTPSSVDVAVNGSTVATNVGTGTFETTIDVAGELNPGAWNTVEVSSDSLGIVEVSGFIAGYDQIGKR